MVDILVNLCLIAYLVWEVHRGYPQQTVIKVGAVTLLVFNGAAILGRLSRSGRARPAPTSRLMRNDWGQATMIIIVTMVMTSVTGHDTIDVVFVGLAMLVLGILLTMLDWFRQKG